jgi:hypothetical protein
MFGFECFLRALDLAAHHNLHFPLILFLSAMRPWEASGAVEQQRNLLSTSRNLHTIALFCSFETKFRGVHTDNDFRLFVIHFL